MYTRLTAFAAAVGLVAPLMAQVRDNGIHVHGHWKISISNPDGTVVKRLEFENSLTANLGGLVLLSLISGTITAGPLSIGIQTPNNGPAVCNNPTIFILGADLGDIIYDTYENVCTMAQPNANYYEPCNDRAGCFPTLTVTAPTLASQGLTLAGQMTAETSGTILGVVSMLQPCQPSVATAACAATSVFDADGDELTTAPQIIQQSTGGNYPNVQQDNFMFGIPLTAMSFGTAGSCGGTSQPPCQISVVAGQLVSAAVTISFQ